MDEYARLIQQSVDQNNSWSAAQAQKQMDFQREMSNTAHQREVADLKAAGLNPVLSAKLGGASTPTGAMGSTDTGLTSALVDLLGLSLQAANSAAGAAVAASGSGGTLFNLPLIKNPRQPWQIIYNWLIGDEKTRTFYEDQVPVLLGTFFGNPGTAKPTSNVGTGAPTYGSKSRSHAGPKLTLKEVFSTLLK